MAPIQVTDIAVVLPMLTWCCSSYTLLSTYPFLSNIFDDPRFSPTGARSAASLTAIFAACSSNRLIIVVAVACRLLQVRKPACHHKQWKGTDIPHRLLALPPLLQCYQCTASIWQSIHCPHQMLVSKHDHWPRADLFPG